MTEPTFNHRNNWKPIIEQIKRNGSAWTLVDLTNIRFRGTPYVYGYAQAALHAQASQQGWRINTRRSNSGQGAPNEKLYARVNPEPRDIFSADSTSAA